MDGVLYDSMPHHARAWHKMLAEQGITTDPDDFLIRGNDRRRNHRPDFPERA